MGCDLALKAIEGLGDEKPGRARWMRLRRHLERCPGCRASFVRMKAVRDAVERMPRVPAPPGFTEKVLELLPAGTPAEPGVRERTSGRRGLLWIGGAAVFGVALAVGLAVARRLAGQSSMLGKRDDKLSVLGSA